jgi:hypothetical protein
MKHYAIEVDPKKGRFGDAKIIGPDFRLQQRSSIVT